MTIRLDPVLALSPEGWLAAYGRAWEEQDATAFAALFTEDVRYHWTPFEEPRTGREGVAAAVSAAFARQTEIRFCARVLAEVPGGFLAHWTCDLRRPWNDAPVRLDGIFLVERTPVGLCHTFREWWHSSESA